MNTNWIYTEKTAHRFDEYGNILICSEHSKTSEQHQKVLKAFKQSFDIRGHSTMTCPICAEKLLQIKN